MWGRGRLSAEASEALARAGHLGGWMAGVPQAVLPDRWASFSSEVLCRRSNGATLVADRHQNSGFVAHRPCRMRLPS